MPIESVKSFKTSDSKTFLNREEAQLHEVELLIPVHGEESRVAGETFARTVMEHKDALLAILTTRKARAPKVKPVSKKTNAKQLEAA